MVGETLLVFHGNAQTTGLLFIFFLLVPAAKMRFPSQSELEFRIIDDLGRQHILSEERLFYRSAHTYAYEVKTDGKGHPANQVRCLVVVHEKTATLHIDEYWLTHRPRKYTVSTRYGHHHVGLLGLHREQVWSKPVNVEVTVVDNPCSSYDR
jgi:hypothetical protein